MVRLIISYKYIAKIILSTATPTISLPTTRKPKIEIPFFNRSDIFCCPTLIISQQRYNKIGVWLPRFVCKMSVRDAISLF